MTISLADNLFINANTVVGKSAVSKKTQTADKAEDNLSPFTSEAVSQTGVQKKSSDELANDFDKTLAKKTTPKRSSGQADNTDPANEELNTENTDVSINVQELLATPAVQNVTVETNITPAEQLAETDNIIRITSDAAMGSPVISATVSQTDVQQIKTVADEQTALKEQPLSEPVSEILQTPETDQTPAEQNITETVLTVTENQTDVWQQEQTPEITNTQQQPTAEELPIEEVNLQMPDAEISTVPVQNQQITEQQDDENEINIDVEADTTLKDILREIQNTIPHNPEISSTVSQLAENSESNFGNVFAKSIEPEAQNISDTAEIKQSDSDSSNDSILTGLQNLIKEDLQISKTAAPAAELHNVKHTDPTTSIAQQLQYNIQSSLNTNNNEIVIQLNPPELGKVEVKFTEDHTGLNGVLSVDKPLTKYEIQQSLPEIISNLRESGVDIKKIEVVLANQQEQQTMQDNHSAGQNSWSWQQNASSGQHHNSTNIYNQWTFTDTENYSRYSSPDIHYSEDSVNMLV